MVRGVAAAGLKMFAQPGDRASVNKTRTSLFQMRSRFRRRGPAFSEVIDVKRWWRFFVWAGALLWLTIMLVMLAGWLFNGAGMLHGEPLLTRTPPPTVTPPGRGYNVFGDSWQIEPKCITHVTKPCDIFELEFNNVGPVFTPDIGGFFADGSFVRIWPCDPKNGGNPVTGEHCFESVAPPVDHKGTYVLAMRAHNVNGWSDVRFYPQVVYEPSYGPTATRTPVLTRTATPRPTACVGMGGFPCTPTPDWRTPSRTPTPSKTPTPRPTRFTVTVTWTKSDGATGTGVPVLLAGESRWFWFFTPDNPELFVAVLPSACGVNGFIWTKLYAGTNVAVTVVIKDTQTGFSKTYTNPQGQLFQAVVDTAYERCQ